MSTPSRTNTAKDQLPNKKTKLTPACKRPGHSSNAHVTWELLTAVHVRSSLLLLQGHFNCHFPMSFEPICRLVKRECPYQTKRVNLWIGIQWNLDYMTFAKPPKRVLQSISCAILKRMFSCAGARR